ncbi:hypothetical protein ACEU2D_07390 [Brevibacillus laterosporus]|uniref:hypothetical protein n=1 Tax=Brevibacillus laterosporus TaxID=1465 RepID=UPI0035A5C783
MQRVQSSIQKVKDMIHGRDQSMARAMQIFTEVRQDLEKIRKDQTLSAVGIAQKERERQEEGAVALAQMVREYKSAIDKELDSAEKIAKSILTRQSTSPDASVLVPFTEKYQELKTELKVFGGYANAKKMIEFMRDVEDPYLAKVLKDGFSEYGPSLNDHVDYLELKGVYDKVKRVAETEEKTTAKTALDEISNLKRATPVNGMIGLGIDQHLGSQYRTILTDHESFLISKGL